MSLISFQAKKMGWKEDEWMGELRLWSSCVLPLSA